MARIYLHIGGIVAVGFDATGSYMLVVSHSGRGVFSTSDWTRVSRDTASAYPVNGQAIGIGVIKGEAIPVVEIDHDGENAFKTPDGRCVLLCESHIIEVRPMPSSDQTASQARAI